MQRSINPWPALSDLFSALLVASFGGLMLFTGVRDRKAEEATRLQTQVQKALQAQLGGDVRSAGGDVFLDVQLHFDLNDQEVNSEDRERIGRACAALRELFAKNPTWRNEVEIWIEGHTDNVQAKRATTERDRYLFNWWLSSHRAISVLYEFQKCGVDPRDHRIMAIGYADSKPLKPSSTEQEDRENRRTTFRIHPDRCLIEARLNGKDQRSCIVQ